MGNYATTTDLLGRFASSEEAASATDNESAGTPNLSVLTECINSAEGKINSYVGVRFLTPVNVSLDASLASLLLGVTLDLAEHYVLIRSPSSSDRKKEQHDLQISWLERIADGTAVLTGAVGLPGTESLVSTAFWSSSDRELPDPGPRGYSRETLVKL